MIDLTGRYLGGPPTNRKNLSQYGARGVSPNLGWKCSSDSDLSFDRAVGFKQTCFGLDVLHKSTNIVRNTCLQFTRERIRVSASKLAATAVSVTYTTCKKACINTFTNRFCSRLLSSALPRKLWSQNVEVVCF